MEEIFDNDCYITTDNILTIHAAEHLKTIQKHFAYDQDSPSLAAESKRERKYFNIDQE